MNIIKMICYRGETAVSNLLAEHLPGYWKDSKRMLVKQIIQTNADLLVDEQKETLKLNCTACQQTDLIRRRKN